MDLQVAHTTWKLRQKTRLIHEAGRVDFPESYFKKTVASIRSIMQEVD